MVTFRIEIINSSQEGVANIFARTLSSKRYLQQLVAAGRVDLYLTPPVQEFQLLGFNTYEKLYRVGYEYAYKRLAAWDGLQRTVSARRNDN